MYKNYWVDTLCSNAMLINDDFFKEIVTDMTAKMKVYNIKNKSRDVDSDAKNDIHQKRLNDIATLNSQANINLQNELLKGMAFQ